MGRSSKFGIIRFSSNSVRDERLNIALIIFNAEGVDIRISKHVEKVRAISAAVKLDTIVSLTQKLKLLDADFSNESSRDISERAKYLSKMGPISIEIKGSFVWDTAASYEERIEIIMKAMIEPEPAVLLKRQKRTRLLSEMKKIFREKHVLALRNEGLESHRIISSYELDDSLVVDMMLKNGQYHVIQSVDASDEENSIRRTIAEIAISALIIERAKMKFTDHGVRGKLIYSASAGMERIAAPSLYAVEHQGAELINWKSAENRNKFINEILNLSVPSKSRKRRKFISNEKGGLFH